MWINCWNWSITDFAIFFTINVSSEEMPPFFLFFLSFFQRKYCRMFGRQLMHFANTFLWSSLYVAGVLWKKNLFAYSYFHFCIILSLDELGLCALFFLYNTLYFSLSVSLSRSFSILHFLCSCLILSSTCSVEGLFRYASWSTDNMFILLYALSHSFIQMGLWHNAF